MRRLTLVFLVLLPSSSGVPSGEAGGETHEVRIEGMRFEPEELTVAAGDRIVWVNGDLVPHTATSKAAGFDSKTIPPEESWAYTAQEEGTFPYLCTLHPTMTATLHVK